MNFELMYHFNAA